MEAPFVDPLVVDSVQCGVSTASDRSTFERNLRCVVKDNLNVPGDNLNLHTGLAVASREIKFPPEPHLSLQSCSELLSTLEMRAGSAGLTAELCLRLFNCLAGDHGHNRQAQKAACARVDSSTEAGQSFINDAQNAAAFFFSWMAPPCGTSSKAREIPLSAAQRASGCPLPKPLRSARFPRGFPWLNGSDKIRVDAANRIYDLFCVFAWNCLKINVFFLQLRTLVDPGSGAFCPTFL